MNIVRKQATNPAAVPSYTEWDPFRMMRELMRWDPFREMAAIPTGDRAGYLPDVDVKETPEGYVFTADVPGIQEKDLEVAVLGNRLTISGKREEQRKEEKASYYFAERSWGSFTRSFTLPGGTDLEKVHADLKDGVLTILVPKKPEVQPKKIHVHGSDKKA